MHAPKKTAHPMLDSELEQLFNYFEAKRARKEAPNLLSLVNPSGAAFSHRASRNLKGYKEVIYQAADEGRTEFFIELGKLLEGKRLKPNTWSKLDQDTAFILCFDPTIKNRDAVELLKRLRHPAMTPWAFKQKRYNWKRAAAKRRELWKNAGWKDDFPNSFLDGNTA
jgi:hypothetical protein